jgi:hypothetical protein
MRNILGRAIAISTEILILHVLYETVGVKTTVIVFLLQAVSSLLIRD